MAVSAGVLLIIARGNAEGDQAAAEPAADKAENETEDPSQGALILTHLGHAGMTAVLASHSDWVVWPMAFGEGTAIVAAIDDDCCRGGGLLHHHRLSWLLHHWLTWLLHHHGLSGLHHHGLSGLLHHGLTGHNWLTSCWINGLTLEKLLLISCILWFLIHLCSFSFPIFFLEIIINTNNTTSY